MRLILLLLFWFTLLPAHLDAQSEVDRLNPEEYFDFWIGEWDVSWDEGDGTRGRGTNTIQKILDGTVIKENFEITKGQNSGFRGVSISVYQPRFDRWKQAWADNNGGYYDFTGKIDGNKRIFQTDIAELEDGREFIQRMVFYDITEESLIWDWESSEDGGETWNLNWRIFYERR
jgi:hypothetical protein